MGLERTFSIIKPDATRRNLTGKINAKFEDAGLRVVAQKRIHMTKEQAGKFYEVHSERPFYDELCDFMSSEPVIVQVLEGESAISKNREVMGATNPADAAPGTIRADFAESMGENSVHGSDAPETAAIEIAYFFSGIELVGQFQLLRYNVNVTILNLRTGLIGFEPVLFYIQLKLLYNEFGRNPYKTEEVSILTAKF